MKEAPQDVQDMARATSDNDLDAVKRILARKPNLSHCLDGYSRIGEDKDLTILKMLLAAGADINDRSFGESLLHNAVEIILDMCGERYGTKLDWIEVGQLIELGADPLNKDNQGRDILAIADGWGVRSILEAYLQSIKIPLRPDTPNNSPERMPS